MKTLLDSLIKMMLWPDGYWGGFLGFMLLLYTLGIIVAAH